MAGGKLARLAQLAQSLQAQGFDRAVATVAGVSVRCSQCDALVVNGTPTHERGCPNQVYECKGCHAIVARAGQYCEDCQ